jgi:hypothetical protein
MDRERRVAAVAARATSVLKRNLPNTAEIGIQKVEELK